ncbi:MAG: DNA repair protein RadC [Pseudomonadota bacterium]|jgi:DNA repair protein RadC|uniref:DNA repair protein RadC n=1 Tax=Banduia mediterranea TaxID=3075609 RepID=A0ABU2WFQ7_9GAMM|nr:DNA repair protein RadC [Algiphilus sp. W345]MDT0495927.1 DNA repair protein RadC [Algiphilus sp. W345]MEC9357420.1 DNA repair protein RadC [Pseudomonadota bacterium]
MGIKDWPAAERPRERLLQQGAAALTDAELLAIFLRTGIPGASALDLARQLLAHFGGLRGLLAADRTSFSAVKGMGDAKYAQLQAALEMARRHLAEQLPQRDALKNPEDARRWLQLRLRDEPVEIFGMLLLDNQHRVIGFDALSHGTIDGASVYPREVVKRVLAKNAAAVILAHNHPSGVSEPSPADRSLTERLRQALALVDVRVLDHIVVGETLTSFAERGWI